MAGPPPTPHESSGMMPPDDDVPPPSASATASLNGKLHDFTQSLSRDEKRAYLQWKRKVEEKEGKRQFLEGQRSALSKARKIYAKFEDARARYYNGMKNRSKGATQNMIRHDINRLYDMYKLHSQRFGKFLNDRHELAFVRLKWHACRSHTYEKCERDAVEASFTCAGPLCHGHCRRCGKMPDRD